MKRNARKFGLTLSALMLVAAILVLPAGAALADYWPMFNRDLLNTGVADPALTGIAVPAEMWSYTTDNEIGSGSPVIADIDDDGQPEVLVSTANFAKTGGIYAFENDGTLKWKYQTGDYGTYATPPLADIDGDGKLETIFPSYAGKIIAVDDDGTQMWIIDTGPYSYGTRSVIADLTVDAGLEVVVGAANKTFMLKASDGTQLWEAPYRMLCDPAIVDVDGDGKLEVVFSASGKIIVALNAEDLTLAWESALMGQDAQNNLAIISDINDDGKPDVVAGSRDYKLYVFSGADGAELWNYGVVGRCFSAAVADFNGDGFDDVVTTACKSTPESYAYLLDVKNQTLLWQHDIVGMAGHTTEGSPSIIADVNGDGTPDVVIAGLSKTLYALSGFDGSEIWTIATKYPEAGVTAIGDLDGDGGMEIVVSERSGGNSVQVFTQEPPPIVPMSEFQIDHAKLDFKKKFDDDKVRVQGKLKLDLDNGDGVKISEDVIVTVGSFSETIPGGTMVEKGKKGEKWEYKRPKDDAGDIKHMTIDWKNGKFDIRMDKADLTGVTNPVFISVQIGDDVGSESIPMKVHKHHLDYKYKNKMGKKTEAAEIEPVAITDPLKVVAYPNPIRDVDTATFQVMGTLATQVEEIRVQIYDLSGRLVWEDTALGSELDWHTNCLSGDYLANGIYLYSVQVRIGGNWINQDIGKVAVLR